MLRRFADMLDTEEWAGLRDWAADFLNEMLDELVADDAFGTEGQHDPRGDRAAGPVAPAATATLGRAERAAGAREQAPLSAASVRLAAVGLLDQSHRPPSPLSVVEEGAKQARHRVPSGYRCLPHDLPLMYWCSGCEPAPPFDVLADRSRISGIDAALRDMVTLVERGLSIVTHGRPSTEEAQRLLDRARAALECHRVRSYMEEQHEVLWGVRRDLAGADLADLAESVMERCDGEWIMARKEISASLMRLAVRADADKVRI